MNASAEQIASLVKIALGLGDLCEQVVLVGGAAVGLLISDAGASEARVTIDVAPAFLFDDSPASENPVREHQPR